MRFASVDNGRNENDVLSSVNGREFATAVMPRWGERCVKAVQFDRYGGIEVLRIAELTIPEPGNGEVLIEVKATSINPGESKLRSGMLQSDIPLTFPSGQGTDLAGVVIDIGDAVADVALGDEVIGFTRKHASHAEYVLAEVRNLIPKPRNISWEVAGSLAIAGTTAHAAVRAVALRPGDIVAVSAAAGGVGSIAVQLARLAGATVIGIARPENHAWLAARDVMPLAYDKNLAANLTKLHITALVDAYGDGYVELAIKLGVARDRINTIMDFQAARQHGVKTQGFDARAEVLAELAGLIAAGSLDVPIAATFPLAAVQTAYRQLEQGHTRGKIVLRP